MREVQIATYFYLHWTPGSKQHVGFTSWVNSTKFLTRNHKSDHVFLVAKAVSAIANENHRFSSQKILQPCAVPWVKLATAHGYFRIPTPYQKRKHTEVVHHLLRSLDVVVVRLLPSMTPEQLRGPQKELVFQTPLLQVLNSLLNFWGVPAVDSIPQLNNYPETLYDESCRHKNWWWESSMGMSSDNPFATKHHSSMWEFGKTILRRRDDQSIYRTLYPSCSELLREKRAKSNPVGEKRDGVEVLPQFSSPLLRTVDGRWLPGSFFVAYRNSLSKRFKTSTGAPSIKQISLIWWW